MSKLKIQHTGNVDVGIPDMFATTDGVYIGVVGGANGLASTSGSGAIAIVANIAVNGSTYAGPAFIVAQKGKRKFLVANTANASIANVCVLSNVAYAATGSGLSAGQMTMLVTTSGGNITVASVNNKYVTGFAADYVDSTNYGTQTSATRYLATFTSGGANATVQPGSTSAVANVRSF